jgi:Flp pilus assembly protein TadD
MELEDYRGAIADFTKAIEFQAENPQNYSKRGSCQLLLNKKEDACLDFSKAGELGLAEAYDLIKKNCK